MSRNSRIGPASPNDNGERRDRPADQVPGCRTILVFNFFKGILHRGIPLYADNLCAAFEEEGFVCRQLTCPRILGRLPQSFLNLIFVFVEQVVVPIAGLRFDKVIYSYNSVALLSAFSRKTAVVVHDYLSTRGRNTSLAACYLRFTHATIAKAGTDVIYVSQSTERVGHMLHRFSKSRTFLFPNAFYLFQNLICAAPERGDELLLCSGIGKNKDLVGALKLYLDSGLWRQHRLRILGLTGQTAVVNEFCLQNPQLGDLISVLPQVSDRTVVEEYEKAVWVWVHSLAEGYGRSIAEARMCGARVVASSIPPFREQADEATFLYRGLQEFNKAVRRCIALGTQTTRRAPPEHEVLRMEIRRFLKQSAPSRISGPTV